MAKSVRISLANKCQLLFGLAVVLIISAALAVPWMRMNRLVVQGQEETARQIAAAWLAGKIQLGASLVPLEQAMVNAAPAQNLTVTLIDAEQFSVAQRDPFLARALRRFAARAARQETTSQQRDSAGRSYLRYARAVRQSDLDHIRGVRAALPEAVAASGSADPLRMVLLIQVRTDRVEQQANLNTLYLVGAGLLAGLLAIGVFWFITMRIILSPVRVLRDTASKVSEGDLQIRSEISTGDEFEQLSDTFNKMLESLRAVQEKLRATNKTLDLKLGELAQSNIALYEANKLKGEFLANVSHELRTPLHSIIGFAEVLAEALGDVPPDDKRRRYLANIVTSSRHLLELINDLLDLDKIEAGRMEVNIGSVSVADTCEALLNLIRPQAEKRAIELKLKVQPSIPLVQTDAGKLQQIVFNFLSNAVKFTPERGTVTLTAAVEVAPDALARVRISVSDTGPGIPLEDQKRIFDKFVRLDSSETAAHGGTGVGLTISKELADLLGARVELDSDVGRGATFALIVPLSPQDQGPALMPAEQTAQA